MPNTYDPLGRRLTQSLIRDGYTRARRRYSYRSDGHLNGVEDLTGGHSGYEMDPTGRVTAVRGPQGRERCGYDVQGNQTHASWPDVFPGQEAVGDRRYRGLRLERAGGVRYEYDAQGRITLRQKARLSRRPDTWRYECEAEDRLAAVAIPDGTRWTYLYDPLGRRTAKQRHTADGVGVAERTDFVWDGTTL